MSLTRSQLVQFMSDAVQFCVEHVESGGLPFVGLVVDDDGWASDYGVNQVRESGDPSAHAEIVAMRWTLRERGLGNLKAKILLASGEPCGLCYRFAMQQRIAKVYFAVDSDTAAAWGFDYRGSYQTSAADRLQLAQQASRLPVPRALEPFKRYRQINQFGKRVQSP